jgi:hypothetical protein
LSLNLNLGRLTNSLRGLWEELVERRLWPVVIALVVALVALPVVLSKPAAEAPTPPVPPATGAGSPLAAFQPAVSIEGKKSSEIRKKLRRFRRKNPFTPQGVGGGGGSSSGTAVAPTATTIGGGTTGAGTTLTPTGSGVSAGGTTTGTSGTSTGTSGSTTDNTAVTYYTYTVDVRFGKVGQTDAKTLSRFRALPSSEDPVIVFMGVRNDGETAVFLVSAAATATGDGDCQPSAEECTFLYMKKGDKQTVEAVGQDNQVVDYELEMRDVNVKKTTAPKGTKSSSSSRAAHGSRARTSFNRTIRSFERLGF